jgi:hypothetical protein
MDTYKKTKITGLQFRTPPKERLGETKQQPSPQPNIYQANEYDYVSNNDNKYLQLVNFKARRNESMFFKDITPNDIVRDMLTVNEIAEQPTLDNKFKYETLHTKYSVFTFNDRQYNCMPFMDIGDLNINDYAEPTIPIMYTQDLPTDILKDMKQGDTFDDINYQSIYNAKLYPDFLLKTNSLLSESSYIKNNPLFLLKNDNWQKLKETSNNWQSISKNNNTLNDFWNLKPTTKQLEFNELTEQDLENFFESADSKNNLHSYILNTLIYDGNNKKLLTLRNEFENNKPIIYKYITGKTLDEHKRNNEYGDNRQWQQKESETKIS